MQGTEGIVACMAKWLSQKYSEKVLEDQIKLNFLSPDSPTHGKFETKRNRDLNKYAILVWAILIPEAFLSYLETKFFSR